MFGRFLRWGQLGSAYNNSLTLLEKIKCIREMVNDLYDNEVELNQKLDDLIKWIEEDGFNVHIANRLEEMLNDGTLADIINVTIFNDLNSEIASMRETLDRELSSIKSDLGNEVETLTTNLNQAIATHEQRVEQLELDVQTQVDEMKGKMKLNQANTFGTFENASVEAIIGNNPEGRSQVLGIPLWDDKTLATYENRDTVASYRSNTNRLATVQTNSANYTVNSVIVPTGTDLSKVQVGMIVDTKHSPKYSGFITGIEGNTLQINNWYQVGNTAIGQVPPNGVGLYIDMPTKIWVDNVNLYLEDLPGQPYNGGSIAEFGMLNFQEDGGDRNGLDIVSLGDKRPNSSFISRSDKPTNKWLNGFLSVNSENALVSNNAEDVGNLIHNTASGYWIRHNGTANMLRLNMENTSQTNNINPKYAPVYIMTTAGDYNLPSPDTCAGHLQIICNGSGHNIELTGTFVDGGTHNIRKGINFLFSDGANWHVGATQL